ncbi:hypothetical protein LZ017_13940 [Pelomonas sp. CA6]|uniref:hypothetical protein n=1 Tax=Pelomonas sp. CA6 TaxID=2907999 RepID=UPI001F4BECB2|nr:hypothetical protein [Pelomonas sp. CA6]MCH7344480.1 hypothetical protein [Pelomonas sp. CA6]
MSWQRLLRACRGSRRIARWVARPELAGAGGVCHEHLPAQTPQQRRHRYLIAETNGLTVDGTTLLEEKLVLTIPNKVTNIHNNASTFRPYNPGEAMGRVDPMLPDPPPPPKGDGCGGIGTALMIVVAVVVTIYTAGAAASSLASGATFSTSAGVATVGSASTFSTGLATLSGGLVGASGASVLGATIGSAAIGAAAGSIASQLTGLATGVIDQFSWKDVGQAALSGGITAGMGNVLNSLGSTAGTLGGAVNQKGWAGAAIRAGLGSAVSQAMQGRWSWREVAASTVAGAAGHAAGEAIGSAFAAGGHETLGKIAGQALGAAAGGWASSQILGYSGEQTRARMGQAFISGLAGGIGNAIGDSLVTPSQGQGPWSAADHRNGSDIESDAVMERQQTYGLGGMGARLGQAGGDIAASWSTQVDQGIAKAADALPSDELLARRRDVEEQVWLDVRGQEAREASLSGAQMFAMGGPLRNIPRGGIGNFEMVRNGNWDAALNIAADPVGLLGEVVGLQADLAHINRSQAEQRIEGMRRAMTDLGVKDVPSGYTESWVTGADGTSRNVRDYGATANRLQGAYESYVRDQRLRETWGDDYQTVRIGKSQMTVMEFEKRVLDIHQSATDRAYAVGVDLIARKEIDVQPGQYAKELGNFIDKEVRFDLRGFARAEGINDSSMSNVWAINRRIKNEFEIGIPDNRLGYNLYADTTLARKNAYTPQIMKWNEIRPGNFLIIRPTEMGGSYAIPRGAIPQFKPIGRGI